MPFGGSSLLPRDLIVQLLCLCIACWWTLIGCGGLEVCQRQRERQHQGSKREETQRTNTYEAVKHMFIHVYFLLYDGMDRGKGVCRCITYIHTYLHMHVYETKTHLQNESSRDLTFWVWIPISLCIDLTPFSLKKVIGTWWKNPYTPLTRRLALLLLVKCTHRLLLH